GERLAAALLLLLATKQLVGDVQSRQHGEPHAVAGGGGVGGCTHFFVHIGCEAVHIFDVEHAADGIALAPNLNGHHLRFCHPLLLKCSSLPTVPACRTRGRESIHVPCAARSLRRGPLPSRRAVLWRPRARATAARCPPWRGRRRSSAGQSWRPTSSLSLPGDRWVRGRQNGMRHATWEPPVG